MTLSLIKKKKKNGESYLVPSLLSDIFEPNRFLGGELPMFDAARRIPPVNIKETDKELHVELAVPGMKKSDFKVQVENKTLTVSAEKSEEKEEKDEDYTKKEYNYQSFSRSFMLPEYAKTEDIQAHYTDGVLKLSVPKKETANNKNRKEIKIV